VTGRSGGHTLLDPADVQGGRSEVHLIPVEVDQLGRPGYGPRSKMTLRLLAGIGMVFLSEKP
jgi:hypothetical protein